MLFSYSISIVVFVVAMPALAVGDTVWLLPEKNSECGLGIRVIKKASSYQYYGVDGNNKVHGFSSRTTTLVSKEKKQNVEYEPPPPAVENFEEEAARIWEQYQKGNEMPGAKTTENASSASAGSETCAAQPAQECQAVSSSDDTHKDGESAEVAADAGCPPYPKSTDRNDTLKHLPEYQMKSPPGRQPASLSPKVSVEAPVITVDDDDLSDDICGDSDIDKLPPCKPCKPDTTTNDDVEESGCGTTRRMPKLRRQNATVGMDDDSDDAMLAGVFAGIISSEDEDEGHDRCGISDSAKGADLDDAGDCKTVDPAEDRICRGGS